MPKQNCNYRKKWYKGRRKTEVGRAKVCLRLILQLGRITVISLMDLEELLFIIEEAWREENILLQIAVLKVCLK